jgi:mannosyltransferase
MAVDTATARRAIPIAAARVPHRWLLAGITALAAVVRFATVNSQSLWYDETQTVALVKLPLGDMLRTIPGQEITPHLYDVVAWGWTHLFGTGPAGIRSLSALLGTATVLVVYAAARELSTERVALVAAAVAAVNPMLVWYSQEARSYPLLILLVALAFWSFARILRRPTAGNFAGWALASGLALITHYFAFFAIVAEAAYLLVRGPARRMTMAALTGIGVVGLAILPVEQEQYGRHDAEVLTVGQPLDDRLVDVVKEFLLGPTGHFAFRGAVWLAGALVAAGLILLVVRARGQERAGAWVSGWVAAGVGGLAIAFSLLGPDYLVPRNLVVGLIPAIVVVAAGFGSRRAGWLGLGAAGALCALSLVVLVKITAEPRLQRDDWRGAAGVLTPAPVPRAVVVNPGATSTVGYYMPGAKVTPWGAPPVRVQEIAFLVVGPPAPATPASPVSGFRLVQRRDEPTYTLIRFRADAPRRVSTAVLGAANLRGDPPGTLILLQRSVG